MRPRKADHDLIVGGKQLVVLQSIFRLKEEAYGGGIYGDLLSAGNRTALPQIYSILEKLNEKGLLDFHFTEPGTSRGARSRKVYTITGKGQKVLNASNIENARKDQQGTIAIPGLARS